MISFRYHIFTIAAIFLAIALGIVVGNIYVQPGLVNNLRSQTEALRGDMSELRAQVGDLETRESQLQQAGDILSELDEGGLAGVQVAIVTQDGADDRMLTQARESLDTAQAEVVAVLSVTERMGGTDSLARQDLAQIVGLSAESDPALLEKAAAALLAQRLANGATVPAEAAPGSDPLEQFLRGQFVRFPPRLPKISEEALPQFGGRDLVVVVLDGGEVEPTPDVASFMIPFVNELVRLGSNVAACESSSTDYAFVPTLRLVGRAGGTPMVTVDDVDLSTGGAALALGLERLLLLGEGGDYGIKGDVRPIPPLT
ncbi:MAG TPA: copper transporter [Actinomycetota bacterium]